ncbi:MAG: energy transducer TonB [Candidatus Kuenenia sp.]|nr:energy transducer TonB [Candidatus Kuenenia hertensis]
MRMLIPFFLAIAIHIAAFTLGNTLYKPPEVHFKHGESAIQMKLVASVQSHEQKKPDDEGEVVNDLADNSENEPEAFVETEVQELPEPAVKTEETGISEHPVVKEDMLTKDHAIAERNEPAQDVPQNTTKTDQKKSREVPKQPDENKITNDAVARKKTIPDPAAQAKEDAVPSKEIIADMLTKGIQNPGIMDVKKPRYPNSCRKKGCEGVCVLRAVISKEGKCTDIQIVKTAGCSKLDESAIESLKKAKFTPAERFGVKVNGTKEIVFRFKIENQEE